MPTLRGKPKNYFHAGSSRHDRPDDPIAGWVSRVSGEPLMIVQSWSLRLTRSRAPGRNYCPVLPDVRGTVRGLVQGRLRDVKKLAATDAVYVVLVAPRLRQVAFYGPAYLELKQFNGNVHGSIIAAGAWGSHATARR